MKDESGRRSVPRPLVTDFEEIRAQVDVMIDQLGFACHPRIARQECNGGPSSPTRSSRPTLQGRLGTDSETRANLGLSLADGMNAERILIAAECVGVGNFFVERAVKYTGERRFWLAGRTKSGRPIPIARAYAALTAAIRRRMSNHARALPDTSALSTSTLSMRAKCPTSARLRRSS